MTARQYATASEDDCRLRGSGTISRQLETKAERLVPNVLVFLCFGLL